MWSAALDRMSRGSDVRAVLATRQLVHTVLAPLGCPLGCPLRCPLGCPLGCPRGCPLGCPPGCPLECPLVCPLVCPLECPLECPLVCPRGSQGSPQASLLEAQNCTDTGCSGSTSTRHQVQPIQQAAAEDGMSVFGQTAVLSACARRAGGRIENVRRRRTLRPHTASAGG